MAKKQSLSYGPNMGLIAGEAQVAKSEAGLSNSVGAFAQGFMGVFGAIKKDEEEQAAKMEAYSAQVPNLDQIHFMKDESNKQVVRTFLNKQRDEYNKLAQIFDKTKDRDVKDKMEAIKFSLVNLNDQIKVFNQDKADYITAFDEGQLAKGNAQPNGAYFTDVYTNNSQFGIGDNGDLSFTVGGQTSLFKDRAGTWNPRNNISETFFLDNFQKEIGNAQKGGKFIESTTYNRLFNNLRSTGNDGLQALITQDLVGDSSNDTFEQQFASGTLDPKIYAGYESYKLDKSDPRFKKGKYEYDTDFMFKNENGDKVRGLVAQYFTNVTRTGHALNYSQKLEGGKNVIELPWGQKALPPQTERERNIITAVESILKNQKYVTIGGSGFELQKDGTYKQITAMQGGKEGDVPNGPVLSKIDMIQKYGGRFGQIPNDFSFEQKKPDNQIFQGSGAGRFQPVSSKKMTAEELINIYS